jgi:DNA-directed RNA polymerase specialized sigma24 family protein
MTRQLVSCAARAYNAPAPVETWVLKMAAEDSIAGWYDRLQAGDEDAARELWDRYFPRLVGLARDKLAGLRRRVAADEEDVALSAFDSFCQRARRGEFTDIRAADSLWRVLATITARKAARLVRDQHRLKRGGGAVAGESGFAGLDPAASTPGGINRVAGPTLSPLVEAEVAEGMVRLLDLLGDDELRRVALMKMDGHTNLEIGSMLRCAPATVERRLALIRRIWNQAAADDE